MNVANMYSCLTSESFSDDEFNEIIEIENTHKENHASDTDDADDVDDTDDAKSDIDMRVDIDSSIDNNFDQNIKQHDKKTLSNPYTKLELQIDKEDCKKNEKKSKSKRFKKKSKTVKSPNSIISPDFDSPKKLSSPKPCGLDKPPGLSRPKKMPIKLNEFGVYDEYANLPNTLQEAYDMKQDLTLKQIAMIMGLNWLQGEMFNVIHDNLQKSVRKRVIKITYEKRAFLVSLYNWYNLLLIENMILKMFDSY
jgi:hypothetical protein